MAAGPPTFLTRVSPLFLGGQSFLLPEESQ
jgi:hypothetical protein